MFPAMRMTEGRQKAWQPLLWRWRHAELSRTDVCPPGLLGSGDKQATSPLWNYPTMSCFTIRKLSGLQRTDLNWKRKKNVQRISSNGKSQERQLPGEFSFICFTSWIPLPPFFPFPLPNSSQVTFLMFWNILLGYAGGLRNGPCLLPGPAPIITGLCLARKYFCIWKAPPGTATTSPGQGSSQ